MNEFLYPKEIYLVSALDETGAVLTEVLLDACRARTDGGVIAVNRQSPLHEAIAKTGEYVIVQPSGEMKDIVKGLTGGALNTESLDYLPAEKTKIPLLKGGRIYRECRVQDRKVVGDSTVFNGETIASKVVETHSTRLFLMGKGPAISAVPANRDLPQRIVLITSHADDNAPNVMTIGWSIYCSHEPVMIAIWIGKTNYSYSLIRDSGEFGYVIPGDDMGDEVSYCGTSSGRDVDKFKELSLEVSPASYIAAPLINKAMVNMECQIKTEMDWGAHTIFIGEVKKIHSSDEAKKMLFYLGGPWGDVSSYGALHEIVDEIGE